MLAILVVLSEHAHYRAPRLFPDVTRPPSASATARRAGLVDLATGLLSVVPVRWIARRRAAGVSHFHDVTREWLEPRLQHLVDNGYRTATCDEIARFVIHGASPGHERSVSTFDDAWAQFVDGRHAAVEAACIESSAVCHPGPPPRQRRRPAVRDLVRSCARCTRAACGTSVAHPDARDDLHAALRRPAS